jgi:DNA invertase Pin-like site-specific DNA recombinase
MTRTASKIALRLQSGPASVTRSEASEEPISIDETALAKLIAFFRLLDNWGREAKSNAETV